MLFRSVDVAEFLRRRLFETDTSVIMTSATLAVAEKPVEGAKLKVAGAESAPRKRAAANSSPLNYFARRVGCESATKLQVGTPFDYERQMKLFTVKKMPDPREHGYADALVHWVEHFVKMTHGKAFVLFTSYKLMQEVADRMQPFFEKLDRKSTRLNSSH